MLNQSNLDNLLKLSDTELRQKISAAAISAGADKFLTAKALADMGKLRRMMSSLTPEQINSVLAGFGSDAASKLAQKLSDENTN